MLHNIFTPTHVPLSWHSRILIGVSSPLMRGARRRGGRRVRGKGGGEEGGEEDSLS